VYDTIDIESLDIPAVALVNKDFVPNAESAARSKGMPGLRIVKETIPCECMIQDKIEAGVSSVIDHIVDALTRPLADEERCPKQREAKELPQTIFKGNLEEVNRFFYKRGWTDGLPIIPPTEEAVEEMLAGTDLPPDHLVGKMAPRLGKATVKKIAINAVMAGALPTYMPLLMAGVEALLDQDSAFEGKGVSTGAFAPFWIVNGPIRNDLLVNSGSGALSPGDIANAAIGRAMGLIAKNIGGMRKGIEDMGTIGNPSKYSTVIAENEEGSPWGPLHVDFGFDKDDSTVTLFLPHCNIMVRPFGSDDKGILNALLFNALPFSVLPWVNGLLLIVMPPAHANILATRGWTKKDIQTFLAEYASVPAYRHPLYYGAHSGVAPRGWKPLNPDDSVRIFNNAGCIGIIVAGGPGDVLGMFTEGGVATIRWVTKKVELPANWHKLVNRYKNLVPKYAS
jgi:hypothetical protein